MNTFNIGENSDNVIVEHIKNWSGSYDKAGGYLLRYFIELLCFVGVSNSNFVTDTWGRRLLKSKRKEKAKSNDVEKDNLSGLFIDSNVSGHEYHCFKSPPFQAKHHCQRNSKCQVLVQPLERPGIWHLHRFLNAWSDLRVPDKWNVHW